MDDSGRLLAAYDDQLRCETEVTPGALSVTRHGSLWPITFDGGRGWVTYRDLGGADAAGLRRLVSEALEHYRRGAGARDRRAAARRCHAPPGHRRGGRPRDERDGRRGLRRPGRRADGRHPGAAAGPGRGDGDPGRRGPRGHGPRRPPRAGARDGVRRLRGGATVAVWRGRGVYRALTAARARSALRMGATLLHGDSTAWSRPVLERSGFVAVSTTTPYTWRR